MLDDLRRVKELVESELMFLATTPPPEDDFDVGDAAETVATDVDEAAFDSEAAPDAAPGVPGLVTKLSSCSPSGTGPSVFAGQDPGGLTALSPRGTLPVWSPLNLVKSDPANWQWKKPESSVLLGAV